MDILTLSHFVFVIFCLAVMIDNIVLVRKTITNINELEMLERRGFPKDKEISENRERLGQSLMSIVVAIICAWFLISKLFE